MESQEAVAQEKAAATKAIADDAQRDLDEALPALDVAVACLKDLKKSDIDEVRRRQRFHIAVQTTYVWREVSQDGSSHVYDPQLWFAEFRQASDFRLECASSLSKQTNIQMGDIDNCWHSSRPKLDESQ